MLLYNLRGWYFLSCAPFRSGEIILLACASLSSQKMRRTKEYYAIKRNVDVKSRRGKNPVVSLRLFPFIRRLNLDALYGNLKCPGFSPPFSSDVYYCTSAESRRASFARIKRSPVRIAIVTVKHSGITTRALLTKRMRQLVRIYTGDVREYSLV